MPPPYSVRKNSNKTTVATNNTVAWLLALHGLKLVAMFFTSKMTMKDPKQAALVYIMPIVMVFIMWNFSSGLVLYWTVFNVMQIGQQVLTNHMRGKKLRSGFADILTPGH